MYSIKFGWCVLTLAAPSAIQSYPLGSITAEEKVTVFLCMNTIVRFFNYVIYTSFNVQKKS